MITTTTLLSQSRDAAAAVARRCSLDSLLLQQMHASDKAGCVCVCGMSRGHSCDSLSSPLALSVWRPVSRLSLASRSTQRELVRWLTSDGLARTVVHVAILPRRQSSPLILGQSGHSASLALSVHWRRRQRMHSRTTTASNQVAVLVPDSRFWASDGSHRRVSAARKP